jgi:hypothetical protein
LKIAKRLREIGTRADAKRFDPRNEAIVNPYGQQIENRDGATQAEVFHADRAALPFVRAAARRLS